VLRRAWLQHPPREWLANGSRRPARVGRHSDATALILLGENAKNVQTLMGHHSVAFTMDRYADVWPEALSNAGEKAAGLLLAEVVAKR